MQLNEKAENDKVTPLRGESTLQSKPMVQIQPMIQSWLEIQCRMVMGVSAALVCMIQQEEAQDDSHPPVITAHWPATEKVNENLEQLAIRTANQGNGLVQTDKHAEQSDSTGYDRISHVVELRQGQQLIVAIETGRGSSQQLRTLSNILRWSSEWLKFTLQQKPEKDSSELLTVFRLILACLDRNNFVEMITVLVTELASHFNCERVSIGLKKGHHVEVQALSHSASFSEKSNVVRAIGSAMDEALDQDSPICYPSGRAEKPSIMMAHKELVQGVDNGAICTVPMSDGRCLIGAVTLERSLSKPFDEATVKQLEQLVSVLGPMLHVKRQEEQWLITKAWRSLKALVVCLLGSGHVKAKLITLGLVFLSVFLWFAEGGLRVTAISALEGSVQRVVAAPVKGYIAEVNVRPGDLVAENQEMGRLDDRELRLERLNWGSQKQKLVGEYREAMAKNQRAQVSIISAQIKQADSQLQLLDGQLARTKIMAPFAGVIIDGDLSQSLGAPVEKGEVLFKVAPLDDFRLLLKVEEQDIANIQPGQKGMLVLASLPDQRIAFEVERVTSVSTPEGGMNYFRVEAALLSDSSYLRPGMEGVAKIEVGQRKLVWIWSHKLINWLRLKLWSWLP